jgi:hypothetical protein
VKLFDLLKRLARLDKVAGFAGELAPYLAIELLLPGGTLIALLLWLHQRFHHRREADGSLTSRRFRPHLRESGCNDIKR